jgi:hypothetical protein
MQVDKSMILDFMRQQGHDDQKVQKADQDLPSQVDTDQNKEQLESHGIDFQKLVGFLPDSMAKSVGDLGSKFGM